MKLHEAIEYVLKQHHDHIASIEDISDEINKQKLYQRKDKQPLPAYQVMMRVKLSNLKYKHLFEWIEPNKVRLKN